MIGARFSPTPIQLIKTRALFSSSKNLSIKVPRMHRAKDTWKLIQQTRPDPGHPHNVFHPPYNGFAVGLGILTVVGIGYGSIAFSVASPD